MFSQELTSVHVEEQPRARREPLEERMTNHSDCPRTGRPRSGQRLPWTEQKGLASLVSEVSRR